MAGEIVAQTDMSNDFKDMKILAVDESDPRFLVTPFGNEYLNELNIYEVNEEHMVLSSPTIYTKKVMTKVSQDSSG